MVPARGGIQDAGKRGSPINEDLALLSKVEQVNYFPYPVRLITARRQQDGRPFLSVTLPLMLERKPDGSWKLLPTPEANAWQETLDKDPLDGCPWEGNTLEKDIAFKPNLEIFLARSPNRAKRDFLMKAEGENLEGKVENGCASFCSPGAPARLKGLEYPDTLAIQGLASSEISLPLKQNFKPFLLLRYKSGEILPVPARLDTVIYDEGRQRLYLGYRATALMDYPLRKMEYRMVPAASAAEDLNRNQAMARYLDSCPKTPLGWAGEPCADPSRPVDMPALGLALGLTPKPVSAKSSGAGAAPAHATQFP